MGNQIAGSFHNLRFEIVYINFYSSGTLSEDYLKKKKKVNYRMIEITFPHV